MTSKAQDRSNQYASSNRWQMLVRHPLLLKALTWLSSLTIMANASVSWAEFKPLEITSPAANPSLVQEAPLQGTASIETAPFSVFSTDGPSDSNQSIVQNSKHKKLHSDLIGANNFTVSVQKKSANLRRVYRAQPGAITAVQPKTSERQLVSSLASNVQPQTIRRVSYSPDAAPELAPLPEVSKPVTPVRSRFQAQPRKQPQIRVEKPQALASLNVPTVPNSLPLYVAPPQSNVVPQVAAIPTVSRPKAPSVAPLPLVQPAPIVSIASSGNTVVPNYGGNSSFIFPLATPAPMTSPYGWRVHPITGNRRFHAGQDLGAPSGTPIVAVADGRVVLANWHGGYGKAVVIEHNGRLQTLYGHMAEIFVQEGQEIKQGTVIGQVGSTGASTGPHLHFETKLPTVDGWVAVDPGEDLRYALNNLEQSMRTVRRPL
jgi:murein DD-endopeptidase MepM/ murein hydrolase activator NlpD